MLAIHAMSHGAAATLLLFALVAFVAGLVISLAPVAKSWTLALLFLGLALVDFWWLWDELARS